MVQVPEVAGAPRLLPERPVLGLRAEGLQMDLQPLGGLRREALGLLEVRVLPRSAVASPGPCTLQARECESPQWELRGLGSPDTCRQQASRADSGSRLSWCARCPLPRGSCGNRDTR